MRLREVPPLLKSLLWGGLIPVRLTNYCGMEKYCPRCGEWWPADDEFFDRDNTNKIGLQTYCKACRTEYMRKWRNG